MIQVEKERKKFQLQIPFILNPGKKIGKKFKKTNKPISGIFFKPKWDDISREREKKKIQSQIPLILDPGQKIPKKIAKN